MYNNATFKRQQRAVKLLIVKLIKRSYIKTVFNNKKIKGREREGNDAYF